MSDEIPRLTAPPRLDASTRTSRPTAGRTPWRVHVVKRIDPLKIAGVTDAASVTEGVRLEIARP